MEKNKIKQLTYKEQHEFISNAVNSCIGQNGEILMYAKKMIVRLLFCHYYTDIDVDLHGLDKSYDKYCNVNYEDYKCKIAWQQFQDILYFIDCRLEDLQKSHEDATRPSIDKLLDVITTYVGTMTDTFKGVDIKQFQEVVEALQEDVTNTSATNLVNSIADTMGKDKLKEKIVASSKKKRIS